MWTISKIQELIKKHPIYHKKRFWASILLAQFLLFYTLSKTPFYIALMEQFFEIKKNIHQKLFALIPFSAGDLFYILISFLLIFYVLQAFRKKNWQAYVLQLLIFTNAFYFVYQLFWGILYFNEPIIDRLPKDKVTEKEVKVLISKYLNRCKQTRMLVKENEQGVFQLQNLEGIKASILQNQRLLPKEISTKKTTEVITMKPSIFRGVMSYSGILGYYNPITAEAQYNPKLPSTYLPFTLAHESAHQLGFAREEEANFIGYLIGVRAKNLDLKYSTEYYVLKSLLTYLAEDHPAYVKAVLQEYSAPMKRDRKAELQFRKKHEGPLDILFGFTNDLFLKSNQQDGNISYSYFIELLVRSERKNRL